VRYRSPTAVGITDLIGVSTFHSYKMRPGWVPSYIRREARAGEDVGAQAAMTASQRLSPLPLQRGSLHRIECRAYAC